MMKQDDDVTTVTLYKSCFKKNKGKAKLITETQGNLLIMLLRREVLVKHVFNYDNTTIHIPVNFRRIINNIQNSLNIKKILW